MSESIHDGPEPIGEIMARYDFSELQGNNPERDNDLVQDTAADDEIAHLLDERQSLRNSEDASQRQQETVDNGRALIEAYMRRLDPNYKQK